MVGNSPSRPDTAGAQAYSAEAQNQVGHTGSPRELQNWRDQAPLKVGYRGGVEKVL